MNNNLPVEEYFKYHPPITSERIAKHNAVNDAALELAKALELARTAYLEFRKAVAINTTDTQWKQHAIAAMFPISELIESGEYLFIIQQARMFANQGITVDELIAKSANDDI